MSVTPLPPRRLALQRDLGALATRAEEAFLLLALFVHSHALLPLLVRGSGADADLMQGDPTLRKVFTVTHAGVLLLCAVRWRRWASAAGREGWAAALLGVALFSVLWSQVPDLTLRRGLALLGTTALGVYLAARYDPMMLLRRVALALGLQAVLSVVLALGVPSLGVDSGIHAGAWQGAFTQKNTLGATMAASALFFLILWRSTPRRRWLAAAGAGLSAALVLLSTSKTALVLLCALAALLPLYNLLRSRHTLAVPTLIVAVVGMSAAGMLLVASREAVLNALGRDVTLTGRTEVWSSAVEAGSARPWLGHGYTAFWLGPKGPSLRIWQQVGWEAPNSHNGYLDLWLELGWVGVALFAASLAAGVARAVALLRSAGGAEALWPLAYLTFVPLYNLTESVLLRQNSVFWVLYVAAVTTAAVYAPAGIRVPTGAAASGPARAATTRRPGWAGVS